MFTDIAKRLRLLVAGTICPAVGAWSSTPTLAGNRPTVRRLLADGSYEYREMTPEEQKRFLAQDAW